MYQLICSESSTALKRFDDNYFHSVVTDPPYLIELFEQAWDSKDNDLTPSSRRRIVCSSLAVTLSRSPFLLPII